MPTPEELQAEYHHQARLVVDVRGFRWLLSEHDRATLQARIAEILAGRLWDADALAAHLLHTLPVVLKCAAELITYRLKAEHLPEEPARCACQSCLRYLLPALGQRRAAVAELRTPPDDVGQRNVQIDDALRKILGGVINKYHRAA